MEKEKTNSLDSLDLTVTHIGAAHMDEPLPGWKGGKKNRDMYGFVFILAGEALFSFPECTERAVESNVVFLKKGSTYAIRAEGEQNLKFIVISFEIAEDGKNKIALLPPLCLLRNSRRVLELFQSARKLFLEKPLGYQMLLKSDVYQILHELFQNSTQKSVAPPLQGRLKMALDHIEKNFSQKLRVSELAELCGYSVSYFRKSFEKACGVPPVKYINKVRIEHAKALLKSGLYSIKETAFLCGFENVHYYTKTFHDMVGCPPGKY